MQLDRDQLSGRLHLVGQQVAAVRHVGHAGLQAQRAGKRAVIEVKVVRAHHQRDGFAHAARWLRRQAPGAAGQRGGRDGEAAGVAAADHGVDKIGAADKVGHETVGRRVIDVGRRAHLHQLAILHHRDAVGHRQRLVLIVRDEHGGDAGALLDGADFDAQRLAQLGVQVGQRFIEQQHLRRGDQRARQRDALLLAAG